MKKYCPHCHSAIKVPPLASYNEHFNCEQCDALLTHSNTDIFIYAIAFIVAITLPLMLFFGVNSFIAIAIAVVGYRLLRPSLFESRFRIIPYY